MKKIENFCDEKMKDKIFIVRKEKGITLVALVVTIIILLILAGVTISITVGQGGLIERTNESVVKTENGSVAEGINLRVLYYQSNENFKARKSLQNDGYIDENGVVDTNKLLGKNTKTGHGSDNKDVYVVEEDSHLYYYKKDGSKVDLGDLVDQKIEELEETDPSLFEISDDGTIYFKYFDDYYYDTKELNIENLVIPREIDGIEVKKIGNLTGTEVRAIKGAEKIKSVYIPNSVTSLEWCAFSYCTSLTSINIPDSVTSIGDFAFEYCSSLTSINIEASEKPSGWDSNWNGDCNAKINWGVSM